MGVSVVSQGILTTPAAPFCLWKRFHWSWRFQKSTKIRTRIGQSRPRCPCPKTNAGDREVPWEFNARPVPKEGPRDRIDTKTTVGARPCQASRASRPLAKKRRQQGRERLRDPRASFDRDHRLLVAGVEPSRSRPPQVLALQGPSHSGHTGPSHERTEKERPRGRETGRIARDSGRACPGSPGIQVRRLLSAFSRPRSAATSASFLARVQLLVWRSRRTASSSVWCRSE